MKIELLWNHYLDIKAPYTMFLIGIQWLSIGAEYTRLDISFGVAQVCITLRDNRKGDEK